MTPHDWWLLTTSLDEAELSWEFTVHGNSIRLTSQDDKTIVTIHAHKGQWLVECEDKVPGGGYYDPPEYEFSHDYLTGDADSVVSHVHSLMQEGHYV